MNYGKIYQELCERGRKRTKIRGSNLEKHHVVPTFFFKNSKRKHRHGDGIYEGDGENVGNVTFLTPREHFIAHLLLCKIWKGTKWEYRCYTSLKMFLIGGEQNKKRSVFDYSSRKYELYKIAANTAISNGKTGTIPVKDVNTGERLGIVDLSHPKVISGEWVHITKGIQKTKEQKMLYSKRSLGLENSNSKYSDDDLFKSYKKCCYYYNKLVSSSFWASYSEKTGLPHIKFWKPFRYNGRGFLGMQEDLLKTSIKENIDIETFSDYSDHNWRKFVKEEKKKWV
jgi:hypothetical protein